MPRTTSECHWKQELQQNGYAVLRTGSVLSETELSQFIQSTFLPYAHTDTDLVGDLIMYIKPNPTRASSKPAYFTNDKFNLHTDLSYMDVPPKYLIMHCVRESPCGGGKCIISNAARAYECLSDTARIELSKEAFTFKYPPGARAGESHNYPVITGQNESFQCRLKDQSMQYHESLESSVLAFRHALEECSEVFKLHSGETLVLDNLRCLHGRTDFEVQQDDAKNRCMMRAYAGELCG